MNRELRTPQVRQARHGPATQALRSLAALKQRAVAAPDFLSEFGDPARPDRRQCCRSALHLATLSPASRALLLSQAGPFALSQAEPFARIANAVRTRMNSPSRARYSGCCSFDACACPCRSPHVTTARSATRSACTTSACWQRQPSHSSMRSPVCVVKLACGLHGTRAWLKCQQPPCGTAPR